jgi:sulfofructose kinase
MARLNSSDRIEFDCIGFGMNVVDYLSILDPYPGLDEKVEVTESSMQGGGPVPTAMATLARLGLKVAYIGKVGDDPEGKFIKAELEKEGVNTDYLMVDKIGKTSHAFIWVDKGSGKRTVALDKTKSNHVERNEFTFMNSIFTRFLHLDARQPEIDIFLSRWAKKLGAEVSLDVGSLRSGVESVFPFVDHLIVSKRFACGFTGLTDPFSACERLMKEGFETVVVTIGEDGCVYASARKPRMSGGQNQVLRSPGFPVRVVDTTGAGDVFHGAFIYGLLNKWDLEKTAQFACATAAMKCTKLGGRAGIPSLVEVTNFIRSFRR